MKGRHVVSTSNPQIKLISVTGDSYKLYKFAVSGVFTEINIYNIELTQKCTDHYWHRSVDDILLMYEDSRK